MHQKPPFSEGVTGFGPAQLCPARVGRRMAHVSLYWRNMGTFSQIGSGVTRTGVLYLFAALMLPTMAVVPSVPADAAQRSPGLVAERGYVVRFEGVSGDLLGRLESVSQLVQRRDTPPPSIGGLRRRAQSDINRMTKVLQSRGYFEGSAAYQIDIRGDAVPQPVDSASSQTDQLPDMDVQPDVPTGPMGVVVSIAPGPQFVMGASRIDYRDTDAATQDLPATLGTFDVAAGAPAIASTILSAEKKLIVVLQQSGFPFAKTAGRKALANVETDTLDVTTHVQLGDKATFGALTVEGLERVEPRYIDERATFKAGEEYDTKKLSEMRAALVRSGLFTGVRFETAKQVAADGSLPVTLKVTERAHRTVGVGAKYSSTEGFGVEAHWENRNLLGEGEQLRFELRLSEIEQEAEARYRVSGFRLPQQTLELGALAGRESTDVYERIGGTLSAALERPLGERWTGRAGVVLDIAEIDEVGEPTETSMLVGVPLRASYDGSNSALDPTSGYRLTVGATPYAGQFNDFLAFHVADAEARTYLPLNNSKSLVFATRGRLGSIVGARTGELPADKRFFAGGAGSIRGFEFQEVAPLGSDGTQEGGRSLVEFSNELRWRFWDDYGIVPFVDGGAVSDASVPDFKDEFAWAGGLGFRYYTSFGPLGVDLAYPITTPSDEEASLKFYVTLGQAF